MIEVMPIGKQDKQSWEILFSEYADFYGMPMTRKTLTTVWVWLFDEDTPCFGLIAKNEVGSSVGFMHYRAELSPLRGESIGYLDDLYVVRSSRGQGVVEQLYERLTIEATINGWAVVRWKTAENNYRGRSVYDKLADKTHWVTYEIQTQI